jgi:hypothetical protein
VEWRCHCQRRYEQQLKCAYLHVLTWAISFTAWLHTCLPHSSSSSACCALSQTCSCSRPVTHCMLWSCTAGPCMLGL